MLYSVVTRVHSWQTTFVQLQSVAIFGHLHSTHPSRLLATSGLLVMWDTFTGWFVDDLKFGHVQIFRWAPCGGVCHLLAAS